MDDKPRKRAPGAGVKTKDGVRDVVRRNVLIDISNLEVLEKIGAGNFSLGVREAARRLKESDNTAEFNSEIHEARQK